MNANDIVVLRKRKFNVKVSYEVTEGESLPSKHSDDEAFEGVRSSWDLSSKSTYWLTRALFLRSLGVVYFTAFIVAFNQNKALLGVNGILPVKNHLEAFENHFKSSKFQKIYYCPTLLWFVDLKYLNHWLDGLALVGMAISLALAAFGAANMVALITLWILYHSIVNVGQTWYGFGWESQMLETGFLAIFFCPTFTFSTFPRKSPSSFTVIIAYHWLMFRIMLGAGLIKIRGDECWTDLTCMDYHYQTQPIPNPMSYYLHQLPKYVHRLETIGNHIVELVLPFLLFWPRKARLSAACIQIMFQVILIISGNLSFLNWLTILPAICCFDDSSLKFLFSERSKNYLHRMVHMNELERKKSRKKNIMKLRTFVDLCLFCLIGYLSIPVVANMLSHKQTMNRSYHPLRIINTYGAFGSVTKTRTEVIIQGTYDGNPYSKSAKWFEYEFKCKPGNVTVRPCFISPYHYRLDWLMWFAAFQNAENNTWFIQLISKLLQNDVAVTALIKRNPFEGLEPPKYIRAERYQYKFTQAGSASAASGQWWIRSRVGTYLQPVSLKMISDYLLSRGFKAPQLF